MADSVHQLLETIRPDISEKSAIGLKSIFFKITKKQPQYAFMAIGMLCSLCNEGKINDSQLDTFVSSIQKLGGLNG